MTEAAIKRPVVKTTLAAALSSPAARNAKGLGGPIFDYYADHPDEAEIFRTTQWMDD